MKRIKSFKLFESSDDVKDIVTVIKDMLLELDFLDIEKRVDIVNNHSARTRAKLQRGQLVEPDVICINLWKKAIKIEGDSQRIDFPGRCSYRASYTWDDVKSVIEPVMEYLLSEGFEWRMDRGTFAYNGVPIISTSGSQEFDTVKSKVEMWFIR